MEIKVLFGGLCRQATAKNRPAQRRNKREGAAAVEFALVGLPFFMLILAIFEVALMLSVNSMLDNAVVSSARLVRTGQVGNQMTQQEFVDEVCSRMVLITTNCKDRLSVDVRPVASFTPIAPPAIINGEFDDSELGFNPGASRSLMLVRVWYQYPIVSPFMQQAMSKLANGTYLMHSTSAFRNEPY